MLLFRRHFFFIFICLNLEKNIIFFKTSAQVSVKRKKIASWLHNTKIMTPNGEYYHNINLRSRNLLVYVLKMML
jgi:hypothetical protein